MHMRAYTCVRVRAYTRTHDWYNTHTYTQVWMLCIRTCIHVLCMYINIVCVSAYVCAHAYTYTYTYTYTAYTCTYTAYTYTST